MRWFASQVFRAWPAGWATAAMAVSAVSAMATPAVETLALQLEYKVFIRGVRVGDAHVLAETGGGRYRVCGSMQTTDVWARIVPWEARFDVRGRIEEASAVPETFRMRELERRKRGRVIHVTDGVLRQVRNGEPLEDQPAPEGVDLMSFFWVTARCDAELVVNNGRKSYAMVLRERNVGDDGTERCDYEVPDDDGKASPARFDIISRHGRRVPQTVTVPAKLRRQLRLVDVSILEDPAGQRAMACPLSDPAADAGDTSSETVHNPAP